ncbi:hypothetical protein SBOR_5390 [Sclerotinia borealis F-4128]|uniref:Small secreted protein n=1 Tax=Sclerotinia borealis (strain F-4128) TaxID=1432307 RepID=W9CEG8_SCLBF|nr:hypothetical protein SBOR_5390 [Sclerotinia borealis F-4128]
MLKTIKIVLLIIFCNIFFLTASSSSLYDSHASEGAPHNPRIIKHGTYDPFEDIFGRATTRVKATTVSQSVSNWIEDVDTVNSFLNVALALPLGPALKSGASKALAFAQDEPVNNKFLGAIPGLDAQGKAAAGTLDKVFGDVLVQLKNVVDKPLSLPVAAKAVGRINVNRCKNVLPSAETLWKSAALAMNISTATWPPKANRENACPGKN